MHAGCLLRRRIEKLTVVLCSSSIVTSIIVVILSILREWGVF